jgi:hypothetical protein
VLFFVWWQFLRGRSSRVQQTPKATPPKAMTVPRGRVRSRR